MRAGNSRKAGGLTQVEPTYRRHLRRLWREQASVRGQGFVALNKWAATTTAWHLYARGGELRGVRRSELQFGMVRAAAASWQSDIGKIYARMTRRALDRVRPHAQSQG